MNLLCFDTDSAEWDSALSGFRYDFYHLREYVTLGLEPDQRAAAFCLEEGANRFLLPVIFSSGHSDKFGQYVDAASPYGYSSPLACLNGSHLEQAEFLRLAIVRLLDELRARGVVSLFVRLHPLLPIPNTILEQFGTVIFHGRTVSVDLRKSEEELWAGGDANDRRRIKKLLNSGCTVGTDETWQHLNDFQAAYTATMQRLNASRFYFFTREYFLNLHRIAPDRFHLIIVKNCYGTVMWGGIFSEFNGIVQFHLSGTKPEFEKLSPTKLALHFVRLWAKERGNFVFHLGGGLGGAEDALFESKKRFGTDFHPFYTWRVVVDPTRFKSLCDEANTANSSETPAGFFPPYRR